MRSFEWNALRVGDEVLVHVETGGRFPLDRGVVAFVDGKRGDNDVGVRLSSVEHEGRVVRPTKLTTHLSSFVDDGCWRCGRELP